MKYSLLVVGVVVSACSGGPALVDTGRVGIVDAAALPPPEKADLTDFTRPSLIGPYDNLSVEVFGIDDLSKKEVRVGSGGEIALPLAGSINASGMTPAELGREIEQRLRRGGVRDPRVAVNVLETLSQMVTVDGEVRRPGNYPLIGRATLMRAIARAEGTTDFANTRHVVIFRTVNNRKMAALYDLRAVRMGVYDDPEIYPNDVIVVGESNVRRLLPTIAQITSVLLTPLVYLLN